MNIAVAERITAKDQQTARSLLKGVKVVDADTHITEWPDLWTSRAPAGFKDRMPQRKTVDGRMVLPCLPAADRWATGGCTAHRR